MTAVRVWPEDKASREALRVLVQRLLPGVEVSFFPAEFEPLRGGHAYVGGSRTQDGVRRAFYRYVARVLAQGDLVVFHEDADVIWSKRRDSQVPVRLERLKPLVLQQAEGPPRTATGTIAQLRGSDYDARLVPCMPTYSLEAWTYQATDRARQLCRSHHRGQDEAMFAVWGEDRAALDEVVKPKEQTCLKDHHNDELAKHVPLDEVIAVGKSLQAFVEALRASPLSAASR